ncbi:hypothetical protein [Terrabacter sp. Ter38]|uniref:hypothetical protein n=1 Tax=Terrabacter sp. Ter38 TaxID=2926030 RepID=UPI002118CFD9|nr:hypothetical protein [Terrabacter sp. Ter38]
MAVWLVTLAVCAYAVLVLTASGTALGDIGPYALFWVLCVLVPGTIVVKAVRGTAGSWLAEVSLGAAAGPSAELVAWALASALDARGLLRLWPLLTLLLFAHPGLRARILSRPHQPWSPLVLMVVAAACAQVVWLVSRSYFQTVPLPPTGRTYYPDLMWHLGLVIEATRAFPLGTPRPRMPGCSSITGSATRTSPRPR